MRSKRLDGAARSQNKRIGSGDKGVLKYSPFVSGGPALHRLCEGGFSWACLPRPVAGDGVGEIATQPDVLGAFNAFDDGGRQVTEDASGGALVIERNFSLGRNAIRVKGDE